MLPLVQNSNQHCLGDCQAFNPLGHGDQLSDINHIFKVIIKLKFGAVHEGPRFEKFKY